MVGSSTVDDREFQVVRKGYDRDEVRAYLGEVEVSFHQLERWAEDAKARLRVAEEKGRRHYDVDEAMVAVFAAKERVLERSRLQAERIEAEAREQAGADYEAAAAAIIGEAEEEARRISEAGLATSERVQYESLGEARAEAERIIEEARTEADRMIKQANATVTSSEDAAADIRAEAERIIGEAEEEARRISEAGLATSERVQYESLGEARAEAERIVEEARAETDRMIEEARAEADRMIKQANATVTSSEDAAADILVVDLTSEGGADDDADDEGTQRRTLYERRSAGLPSIGEGASEILRSLEILREDSSTD